jgi:hypothetical protein
MHLIFLDTYIKMAQIEILGIGNLQKVQESESVNPIIKDLIRGLLLSELADVFKLYEYEISLKEVITDLKAKLKNSIS